MSEQVLFYSLSPAATWQGSIGRGHIVVNVLHPRSEEVEIAKPTERFRKVSDVRYERGFSNLEPTLADDLKIIARRPSDSYYTGNAGGGEENPGSRDYVIEGDHYFLQHADYSATASSTLAASMKGSYAVENLKSADTDLPWCEGAEGDGIGESITLTVKRPLPLMRS